MNVSYQGPRPWFPVQPGGPWTVHGFVEKQIGDIQSPRAAELSVRERPAQQLWRYTGLKFRRGDIQKLSIS